MTSIFQQLNIEISELKQKREQVESKVFELSKNLEMNADENLTLKNENKNLQLDVAKNKDKIQMLRLKHGSVKENEIKNLQYISLPRLSK